MVKVFGLGFQKTGTTTLGVILKRLGYSVAGYHQFRDLAQTKDLCVADLEARAHEILSTYDAAKDTPWPVLYKTLDHRYPGSKFIHVVRNRDAWIRSAVKDFGSHPNEIHRTIYGSLAPVGNEAAWLDRYDRHNSEVAAYFAGRPDDYLRLDLEDGVTFKAICPFLGHPVIEEHPPVANTFLRKRIKLAWWRITGS